ncbi:putative Tim44/TimA family adaptor protein [Candidatus Xenohaliotis californiensis]|uniref:Tim44/TimA family adaptor protein n=1 Tax=Candidatus Xenohaliotis californiensis TaxID=84677 RepID=A0ABM9N7V8_9RICK|nr:putative Tim44/TimA family adaptor protein [Candidatus Xenohaliotis californiensis]
MTAELVEVVFYAVIAIAIFVRLHNILGKVGSGGRVSASRANAKSTRMDNVIDTESEQYVDEDDSEQMTADISKVILDSAVSGVEDSIKRLATEDSSFKVLDFIAKVEIAYEMIINAFTKGDLDTIRPLVDSIVMSKFQDMINERKVRNEIQETTIVAINECKISNVIFFGRIVSIKLQIKSDQLITIKDNDGNIKYGDINKVQKIEDKFTFSRKINSSNPIWTLISID